MSRISSALLAPFLWTGRCSRADYLSEGLLTAGFFMLGLILTGSYGGRHELGEPLFWLVSMGMSVGASVAFLTCPFTAAGLLFFFLYEGGEVGLRLSRLPAPENDVLCAAVCLTTLLLMLASSLHLLALGMRRLRDSGFPFWGGLALVGLMALLSPLALHMSLSSVYYFFLWVGAGLAIQCCLLLRPSMTLPPTA